MKAEQCIEVAKKVRLLAYLNPPNILATLNALLCQIVSKETEDRLLIPARELLVDSYLMLGESQKARMVIDPLLSRKSETLVRHFCFFITAKAFFDAKLCTYALSLFQLGATPSNSSALYWVGLCYDRLGNKERCKLTLIQFCNLADANLELKSSAYALLADMCNRAHLISDMIDFHRKAAKSYQKLTELNPS